MNRKIRNRIPLLILVLLLAPAVGWAHGGDYPRPTRAELEKIEPPLEGAPAFARELHDRARTLLTDAQLEALGRAVRHYHFMDNIRMGRYAGIEPLHDEYHRWRGDQALAELVEGGAASRVFDFTPGAEPPALDYKIDYNAQSHHLLWQVRTGEGPLRFVRQDFSLQPERYALHYTLRVPDSGTTLFLLRLRDVPAEPATVIFQFVHEATGEAFSWHSLTIEPGPTGRLAVEVTEDGGPVPAMIRLESMPSGALWPPQGALDFRPQLHAISEPEQPAFLNIYGPMGSFELRLPGAFRGHYWVVPDGFEMALPAGEWKLTLWRGLETRPVERTLTVKPGQMTRAHVELERWVDMAGRGWFSGDDHVHARMLGDADADRLLDFTRAMDIRVSNILAMGDSQRTYYAQRGFGPDYRAEESGFWLVPGQEDPRSMLGHNIGLNLTAFARDLDRYLALDWLAEEIHGQGGLFGQTHVGQNVCEAHRGMALMVPHEVYDFCSIMQGGLGTELYYDALDLGYRLTATAGSDMPYGGVLGDVRTYVYLGPDGFTPDAWFDAVRAGRTFTTNGPMLEFTVNGALPGDEVVVEDDAPLRVEARAWGLPGESAPVGLEVVRLSQVVGTERSATARGEDLSLTLDLDPGEGCWVAARAWGANQSAAHTTPVWVRRGDRRHWNLARVDEVVDKQLAVLDEIEGVVAGIEAREAAGTLGHFDLWDRLVLRQAEPLRALMQRSRDAYETLRARAREQRGE